mmetsp:Transcript_14151/g.59142  ORF Transcript_14151/g.59142 Transcript_14151/m.59142 type:complete len:237 (-) Transcript_14151:1555-2265(-)
MPESMPQRATCEGTCSSGCNKSGWHNMRMSEPSMPQAEAIWSMRPHGAPTTRFSTFWHSTASSLRSSSKPCAPASALIAATSTDALLLTPLPSGTSECTKIAMPSSKRTPFSRMSTTTAPTTYAAHRRLVSCSKYARARSYDSTSPDASKRSRRSMSKVGARFPASAPVLTRRMEATPCALMAATPASPLASEQLRRSSLCLWRVCCQSLCLPTGCLWRATTHACAMGICSTSDPE